ncbi:hypothetical protein [uncultured Roseibium sp.]|uniref:hypothetical protein n=1 Tax=uncultured Roseibium sp. TaxID=1936171 RepID=UPI00261633E5|nr:hypothetical protein [uncultured Roseibium sp.]
MPAWKDEAGMRAHYKELLPVIAAFGEGEVIEYFDGQEWDAIVFSVAFDSPADHYRIRQVPDSIDWASVNPNFNWMARDEDGKAHLFARKPVRVSDEWILSAPGGSIGSHSSAIETIYFASYSQGNLGWKESLVTRPGAEDESP